MARGYPEALSVAPGQRLVFHAASDQRRFRFDIFRLSVSLVYAGSTPWFDGPAPAGSPTADVDFGWMAFPFDVPASWSSGVYIAAIIEWDGTGTPPGVTPPPSPFADQGLIQFVLRAANPGVNATILYKVSLFTFHAYNFTGGGAFYVRGTPNGVLTLLRPGGGTGGDLAFTAPDPYDPNSHPQTIAYWDAPFIGWLEASYTVDYCTDLDVHADPTVLQNYRLLLSVGHDEYWSPEERANVESFVAAGGNVAFFSGNICEWRVHVEQANTAIRCAKGNPGADHWWDSVSDPENGLTGVSYRNGGGWWGGQRQVVGYTIQQPDHWAFPPQTPAGTVFGQVVPPIIGYECDGARLLPGGPPWQPAYTDGTHRSFRLLAFALLSPTLGDGSTAWADDAREAPSDPPMGPPRAATMGTFANNGVVFAGSTAEWPRVVGFGTDALAQQITRNVLDALSNLASVDVTAIAGRSVAGPPTSWQTPDGEYLVEHLGAVDGDGNVLVFFWSPRADWQVVDVSAITGRKLAPGAPLTNWQTPDGPYNVEHLGGVDASGNVVVFFWSPRADWQALEVSNISGRQLAPAAALTSWQTPDGPYNVEHLGGVDASGNVVVFFWSPRADWQAVEVSAICGRTLAAAAPLTSWQTPDGPYNVEHLGGVDASGNVVVFFWSPRAEWQAVEVSNISGRQLAPAAALTSWQTPDGPYNVEHVAGVDPTGDAIVFFWSPRSDWQAVDASAIAGRGVATGATSWQQWRIDLDDQPLLVERLAALDTTGAAVVFSWSPRHDWSAFDVSANTGVAFVGGITSWQVPDGPFVAEHVAGCTPDNRLVLVYWESPRR